MKVYLDDERPTPEGWVRVYTATEAIELLKTGQVEAISLDHDLGIEEDGYDVALWIDRAAAEGTLKPLRCTCHSANPAGRSRINAALRSAERFWSAGCADPSDE